MTMTMPTMMIKQHDPLEDDDPIRMMTMTIMTPQGWQGWCCPVHSEQQWNIIFLALYCHGYCNIIVRLSLWLLFDDHMFSHVMFDHHQSSNFWELIEYQPTKSSMLRLMWSHQNPSLYHRYPCLPHLDFIIIMYLVPVVAKSIWSDKPLKERACAYFECKLSANMNTMSYLDFQLKCTWATKKPHTCYCSTKYKCLSYPLCSSNHLSEHILFEPSKTKTYHISYRLAMREMGM